MGPGAVGRVLVYVIVAATVTSVELVQSEDSLGRLAPGYLADVIDRILGDPTEDITVTEHVNFVMKGGVVYKTPA